MKITDFIEGIHSLNIDFYTGVPDSQLKALCDYLMSTYNISDKHIVAANEGAAVGLAAGHYLATGHPSLVYMQNSGIGNAINPICSLINEKVYAIPMLFVIGWRGEPNVKDEPQHIFQGEITLSLLDCLEVPYHILSPDSTKEEYADAIQAAQISFNNGKSFAFVIRKNALENPAPQKYTNNYPMTREEAVKMIIEHSLPNDLFVSTTGKLSRELFEIRETLSQGHGKDFLTVGSMGHSSMIALGIALAKKERTVFCLDGDGALLMHMGSLAVAGANTPPNFIHVLVNNGAHETVGGIPTVSAHTNYQEIAGACGYANIYRAETSAQLSQYLKEIRNTEGLAFLEICTNLQSRSDLGRPTTTPIENKLAFMENLRKNI